MKTPEREAMTETEKEIVLEERGRAGLIRLNRPKALNAVTLGMVRELEAFYHRCAKNPDIYGFVMEAEGKAFSAGGDIRAILDWARNDPAQADRYYAEEYQHNWTLQRLRKPHLALIDGVMMGGGIGISLYGTHRIAGENLRFAMPETGIGFFPDVGGSWFLPRMPGMTGIYLGLTGKIVDRADAYYAGVATHCIPASKFETVKAAMVEAEPIDAIVDGLHAHPGVSRIEALREPIDRTFSAGSFDGILRNLEREDGVWKEWAQETLAILSKRSPLSLRVTFEQLKRGQTYKTLKEALVVEYRLAKRMVRLPDFAEGVRAVIIDKDQSPNWKPSSFADVDENFVQSQFEPLPEGDLDLKDYWPLPMQS